MHVCLLPTLPLQPDPRFSFPAGADNVAADQRPAVSCPQLCCSVNGCLYCLAVLLHYFTLNRLCLIRIEHGGGGGSSRDLSVVDPTLVPRG